MAELDASRARNRENQRRARQRQKNHISELEARIARYEKAGVQASQEVQRAARKVAEENKRLRALLDRLGAHEALVDAWLAGDEFPANALVVAEPSTDKDSSYTQHTVASRSPGSSQAGPEKAHIPSLHDDPDGRNGIAAEDNDTITGLCQSQSASHLTSAADETACEDAARIIASMRGAGRHEDVWPELGCSKTVRCTIKNARIFELAGF